MKTTSGGLCFVLLVSGMYCILGISPSSVDRLSDYIFLPHYANPSDVYMKSRFFGTIGEKKSKFRHKYLKKALVPACSSMLPKTQKQMH